MSLASVVLTRAALADTWLPAISLRGVPHATEMPTSPSWPCAIDPARRVLFTQLVSSLGQMRDGYYEYLLAIDGHVLVVVHDGDARLQLPPGWDAFRHDEVRDLVDRCAVITCCDQQAFSWREDPV